MVSSTRSSAYKYEQKPVHHNTVVEGNFPVFEDYKELAIFKFNRFLSFMLIASIMVSMVSYSVVAAKENTVISMHNKTNEINLENIELQNKVDYVKSFYNVNDKMRKVNFLQKAEKVIEVSAVAPKHFVSRDSDQIKTQPLSGF